MKIKNFFASVAAVATTMSLIAAMPVSAASNVVDFEDGNSAFVSMHVDDASSDNSEISVVDFNGSKVLQVKVINPAFTPKIKFDLNALVGTDNLDKINKITMDIGIASQDGTTAAGWNGGAIGVQAPNWSQGDWTVEEYENAASQMVACERTFLLPTDKPANGSEDAHMLVMAWSSENPRYIYVDNIKFLDESGNAIDLAIGAAAPAATEAAPAADTATTSAATGNTTTAAIVSAMAVAGAAAIVAKKRK